MKTRSTRWTHRLLAWACVLVMLQSILPVEVYANITAQLADQPGVEQNDGGDKKPGGGTDPEPTPEPVKTKVKVTGITFDAMGYNGGKTVNPKTAHYTFTPALPKGVVVTGLKFMAESAQVGTHKVSVSVEANKTPALAGKGAEKYELNMTAEEWKALQGTVEIKAKELKITEISFAEKTYNGALDVQVEEVKFAGLMGTHQVELSEQSKKAFKAETVNAGKDVKVLRKPNVTMTLKGKNASVYALVMTGEDWAKLDMKVDVKAKPLTITGITFKNKTFDGKVDVKSELVKEYTFEPARYKDDSVEVTGLSFKTEDIKAAENKRVEVSGTPKSNNKNYTVQMNLEKAPTITVDKATATVKMPKITYTGSNSIPVENIEFYGVDNKKFNEIRGASATLTSKDGVINAGNQQTLTIQFNGNPIDNITRPNYKLPAVITVDVQPKVLEFTVIPANKPYDETTEVTSFTCAPVKGVGVDANTDYTLNLTVDMLEFANADAGENKTVQLKEGAAVKIMAGGTEAVNYELKLDIEKANIEALSEDSFNGCWTLDETVAYTNPDTNEQWYKGETVTITAAENYEVKLKGRGNKWANTVEADTTFRIKNKDKRGVGEITLEKENIHPDGLVPAITDVQVDKVLFGKEAYKYTATITDAGSGVKTESIRYAIAATADETTIPDTEWKECTVEKVGGQYKLTIECPAYGYLWVKVEDNVGNVNCKNIKQALVLENQAPTLEVTCATEGNASQSHRFTVTAADAAEGVVDGFSGIDTIKYVLRPAEREETTYAGDIYNAKQPGSLEELQGLRTATGSVTRSDLDGEYTLEVTAADFSGNKTTVTKELNFDNSDPEVSVSVGNPAAEAADGEYYYNKDNWELKVTFTDANLSRDVNQYQVIVTDPAGTAKTYALTGADGIVTVPATELGTDGEYTITVAATDSAGNIGGITSVTGAKEGTKAAAKEDDDEDYIPSASFVLDATAPVLESVVLSDAQGNYYAAEQKVYYNEDFTVNLVVDELNPARNVTGVYTQVEGEDVSYIQKKITSENGKYKFSFTVEAVEKKENELYGANLHFEDAAGNKMVLGEAVSVNSAKAEANRTLDNNASITDGTAVLNPVMVVDTVAPKAVIDYTNLAGEFYYKEGAYYNTDFAVDYTYTDTNLDNARMFARHNDEAAVNPVEGAHHFDVTAEGEHSFYAWGVDKAGNPLTVTELDRIGSDADDAEKVEKKKPGKPKPEKPDSEKPAPEQVKEGCKDEQSKNDPALKILDKTAPVATLTITPGEGNVNAGLQNERYYFNQHFTAQWDVKEEHFDAERVKAMWGVNKLAENYEEDTVEIDRIRENVKGQQSYILKSEGITDKDHPHNDGVDGLYRFSMKGTDKAGNAMVLAAENKDVQLMEEPFTSYIVVLDRVAPTVGVSVTNNDKNKVFYDAQLSADAEGNHYVVDKNQPYQKTSNATAAFDPTDKSPVELSYAIKSTLENGSVDILQDYVYNKKAESVFHDEQIIRLTKLVAVDRAGNTSTMEKQATKLYLDVEPPKYDDELNPTVDLVTKLPASGNGPEGTPLYDDSVTVEAKVSDSNFEVSSSGLYRVYYQVLVNGRDGVKDWTEQTGVKSQTGIFDDEQPGQIGYNTKGPQKPDKEEKNKKTEDEQLTEKDTITFTFNKAIFNYNDVKLKVWVQDNAGNLVEQKDAKSYSFGIDIVTPKIDITYDNNTARNDKYFKENRVATVVVTERNFDPANTNILTESTAISEWVFTTGEAPNRDDDTWTAKVTFNRDGDYTMAANSTDLLGHKTSKVNYHDSVAPTDFVVDKTAPVTTIHFDNNDVRNGKYYNAQRTAFVDIQEHNFDAVDTQVNVGASIAEGSVARPGVSSWKSTGDKNSTTINFRADGDYTLDVNFQDMAGNKAQSVKADDFTVDQTAPELTILGVQDMSANKGDVAPVIEYHDINYAPDQTEMHLVGENHGSKTMSGGAREGAMGGKFVCENIVAVPENDDVYLCTGHVEDKAGNQTEAQIRFSVNRFGSNYILSDETKELVKDYYTNKRPTVQITEINTDSLKFQEITAVVNGEIVTLKEGEDFTVESFGGAHSWKRYVYTIFEDVFEDDGTYNVTIHSEDRAGNKNSNRSSRVKSYTKPIDFVLDMTAPTAVITGVEEHGQYIDDTRTLTVYAEDNIGLSKVVFMLDGEEAAVFEGDALKTEDGALSMEVGSKNDWQTFTVQSYDLSGNLSDEQSVEFLLTNNLLVQYVNNTPVLVGSLVGLLAVILLIVFMKRKKNGQKGEQK